MTGNDRLRIVTAAAERAQPLKNRKDALTMGHLGHRGADRLVNRVGSDPDPLLISASTEAALLTGIERQVPFGYSNVSFSMMPEKWFGALSFVLTGLVLL